MNRTVWLGWTALLLAVVLIVVALTWPAPAADLPCVTIAEDKAKAERAGLEYLGIREVPWTTDSAIVYYRAGEVTLMSRVMGGCVEPAAHPVGVSRAETRA